MQRGDRVGRNTSFQASRDPATDITISTEAAEQVSTGFDDTAEVEKDRLLQTRVEITGTQAQAIVKKKLVHTHVKTNRSFGP